MKQDEDKTISEILVNVACNSVRYEIVCGVPLTYMDMHAAPHHAPPGEHDMLVIDYCHEGLSCGLRMQPQRISQADGLNGRKFRRFRGAFCEVM